MDVVETPSGELSTVRSARDLAERLRRLPESRWYRRADADSPASASLRLAQRLADVAAGVEARIADAAPQSRPVPDLGALARPDQLDVLTSDLQAAATGLAPQTPVWGPDGRRTALGEVLRGVQADLDALADLAGS